MKRLIQVLVSALGIVTLALLVPLSLGRAGANTLFPHAKALTNPLILHNSVTGASVQMMPSRQWLINHGLPAGTGGTPGQATSSTVPNLPAPTCTLATDDSASDGVVPIANQPATQDDALDISAFGLSTSGTNLTGQLSVQSLSDGVPVGGTPAPAVPAVTGGGDNWYVIWKSGTDPNIIGYFVAAAYPATPADLGYVNDATTSNLPVSFKYGTVTPGSGGIDTLNFAGAASGTFDVANNRITISAPLSVLGAPKTGDGLSAAYARTQAAIGTTGNGPLYINVDTVNTSSNDYVVGQAQPNCPTPKSSGGTGGGSTGGPTGNAPQAPSANNLSYYGGPIVHSIKNYIIWWLPQAGTTTYSDGSSCTLPGTVSYSYEQPASGTTSVPALPGGPDGDTDYTNILTQFFKDESGTAFYNLLNQYADEETGGFGAEAYGGSWTDNCGYTSTPSTTTGPVPGGTQAAPIYQTDIQSEVQKAIQVNHWPTGLGNEYYVFTGANVADCFAPPGQAGLNPTCDVAVPSALATGGYCAYHGDFMDGSGNYVLYADMPSAGTLGNPAVSVCWQTPIGVTDPSHTVNGNPVTDTVADAEVSITSHEQFETVNDAQIGTAYQLAPPLGWYDAANGEIGDKCAYIYGTYNPTDGSNINLHGDHYIVQEEYSNWNNGCALTSYEGNGGYGGSGDSIAIQKGWNVIGVPSSGIANAAALVTDMTRSGQLPHGSITKVELYHKGVYTTYVPPATAAATPTSSSVKYPKPPAPKPTPSPAITRTDGVLVYSTAAGTYTPSGSVYTSAPAITLNPGWNLVSMTYPNPGLSADSIYNQIEAENGACTATITTNAACSATIAEIKITGPSGFSPTDTTNKPLIDWKPSPASSGQATWPQTQGGSIPFTSGMWIYAAKPLTWTPQGNECQTVDSSGVCH